MRIIAGKFGGRIIKVPKSKLVRPTTDKNKEAIFNYLENKIDFDESLVCDLYAGSGSLGFEALSRGALEVHFVEQNFQIYKNLIDNIESLKVKEETKVFKMSCIKFSSLKNLPQYDLIIADPPFFKDDIYKVLNNLIENKFVHENGTIIIERSIQTKDEDIKNFKIEPIKKLGDSLIYEFNFS
ncbi:MAG: 16S rRNA (guanine(966)-N(2))-methyltransferase RsmD [Ignavibacteriae bacterium]|nr:16S rRNA (guanine(966)-N(2))-methyltransferase RsmD [Ignavibacteriota bacterium]MCB9206052.1 16S rRNA (guanine(966)-N(2))-methyltransferase RsmD [Ignavibacteriales bacterium]MCB9209327.1 16S rRNA (guanine(966)-N(2))-methyltransferase RsmD [Ignavibacteriales bacterium]MCB9257971.1 16S rRNA (guanine(966)-N(2))-methyltransferase RsmD [Ignavibacteriales bacterium]